VSATILTIGYEGASIAAFIDNLKRQRVKAVADVRELPLSRKKGFSKTALSDALATTNISYVHLRALGCPGPIRHRYRADRDWKRYSASFIAHLSKQQEALAELAAICERGRTALVCFEHDFNRCHRTFVAREVARLLGSDIAHIVGSAIHRDCAAGTGV
jgi:uncharacterized protein (DUF488 family)